VEQGRRGDAASWLDRFSQDSLADAEPDQAGVWGDEELEPTAAEPVASNCSVERNGRLFRKISVSSLQR